MKLFRPKNGQNLPRPCGSHKNHNDNCKVYVDTGQPWNSSTSCLSDSPHSHTPRAVKIKMPEIAG